MSHHGHAHSGSVSSVRLSPTASLTPTLSAAVTPSVTPSATSGGTTAAAAANNNNNNTTSVPGTGPGSIQHKRVYQACIPCRRRKVRCDLGSVDNPHDPPCVRCRRESKECFFSATRRKRKTDDEGGELLSGDEAEKDEYIIRNGRKRLHASSGQSPPPKQIDRRMYSDVPLTPGGSAGRREPLRRPMDGDGIHKDYHGHHGGGDRHSASRRRPEFGAGEEPSATLNNPEAQNVMRRGVYGPHDALDLLYKAATDDHKREESGVSGGAGGGVASAAAEALAAHHQAQQQQQQQQSGLRFAATHPGTTLPRKSMAARLSADTRVKVEQQPIDPALSRPRDLSLEPGYAQALKAWTRFRFVRAGWFTAQEAIDYIDYYYEYLSPLTPISPPTFRNPASHVTLLTEEPILTVTLLTIASRYRRMPGTGGHCRSHAIHEQLWTYLRGMIERCLWGQEAFGGGLGSATLGDEAQTSSTAPWRGLRKGSLRTLGTIESLMILTEWHPRALHFPPDEAIDELMLPSYEPNELTPVGAGGGGDEENQRAGGAGVGGRRIESWLEPAWRSDRMCWMLLSTAMGLSYELGVFDDIEELLRDGAIDRPEYEEETYRQRAYRIKRLLMVYLTQLAGRLGWTNMVPESLRKSDPAVSRRRPTSVEGTTPGTNPSSVSNAFNYIPDLEMDDQIIHCWAGISNAMHVGNEKLFRSRKHTTEIIQSGKYIDLLKDLQPMLRDWLKEFERFRLPPYIRHILRIEYEYVRIYINSLSLQAVVERSTSAAGTAGAPASTSGVAHDGASATGSAAQLSPQTQNYYGKLPLGQLGGFGAADQEYVREVVDGSRNLLRTVVEGLLPGDYLKHAPVRTYFRIISGAMFLLKTFALGAPRADVKMSIELMDNTVEALRNCVVDDVHLGIRFADLLESLTSRLRNRFIQAPILSVAQQQAGGGGAISSTDGRSPNPHALLGYGADATGLGGGGVNGANGVNGQSNGMEWSAHAASLRDGLNGAMSISATPFDSNLGNFPYPSGAASVLGPSTPAPLEGGGGASLPATGAAAGGTADDFLDWGGGGEMWYLPAGPNFFANVDSGTGVAMTAEGGGMDLLDYMAMEPHFPDMAGTYP